MRLALRNVLFTLIVPGAGAVYGPWLILSRGEPNARPVAWPALALIIGGLLLYGICQWAPRRSAAARRGRGMRRGGLWRWAPIDGCVILSTSRRCLSCSAKRGFSCPLRCSCTRRSLQLHVTSSWCCTRSRHCADDLAPSTSCMNATCGAGLPVRLDGLRRRRQAGQLSIAISASPLARANNLQPDRGHSQVTPAVPWSHTAPRQDFATSSQAAAM